MLELVLLPSAMLLLAAIVGVTLGVGVTRAIRMPEDAAEDGWVEAVPTPAQPVAHRTAAAGSRAVAPGWTAGTTQS